MLHLLHVVNLLRVCVCVCVCLRAERASPATYRNMYISVKGGFPGRVLFGTDCCTVLNTQNTGQSQPNYLGIRSQKILWVPSRRSVVAAHHNKCVVILELRGGGWSLAGGV